MITASEVSKKPGAVHRPPRAGATGLPVSLRDLLECVDFEFLVGDDPLQPGVLALHPESVIEKSKIWS